MTTSLCTTHDHVSCPACIEKEILYDTARLNNDIDLMLSKPVVARTAALAPIVGMALGLLKREHLTTVAREAIRSVLVRMMVEGLDVPPKKAAELATETAWKSA